MRADKKPLALPPFKFEFVFRMLKHSIILGGADTFFGKNKGRTMEAKLSRFTKYF